MSTVRKEHVIKASGDLSRSPDCWFYKISLKKEFEDVQFLHLAQKNAEVVKKCLLCTIASRGQVGTIDASLRTESVKL
jgi:hypothetical protein